ncbi:TIGR01212 family radical SAM protein [Fibrobacter intestinalis]|uniref:TIGR01212 family radical SAM protein n=1 Tax=Fibrobacter intestinalis TaxID=28122 RepID=UPI0023F0C22A|nr:TIGR01212 family radical SAM protein [Fibrobacter intestinalis]MDD7299996.1 TIGR01212 family radical SAM protein [Fibrobacter intestinalis]
MPAYTTYREFLAKIFPSWKRVRKLPLNGGMSCPNLDGTRGFGGCCYCNNKSFSPVWDKAGQSVQEQMAEYLPRIRRKYKDAGILAYFQPYTNTYAPVKRLREIYEPAFASDEVVGVSIGTRPDCVPPDVMELLEYENSRKPVILELGLQTANDETLKAIGRGHSVAEFEDAVKRAHSAGLWVTSHVILGLPGETLKDFEKTAEVIRDLGISAVKIHPLHIVRDTRLAESYRRGEFELLSFEAYCEAVARFIRIVGKDVAIERFSGEAQNETLVAPDWTGDRNRIVSQVERLLLAQNIG